MKVVLVFVSTLNGRITKGDDPEVRNWSSKSDQEYYGRIWKDSRLIVMGSNTFRLNKIEASSGRLVVVLTHNPSAYENRKVEGKIVFSDRSPSELVSDYKNAGYELMTVVGGSQVATSFLRDGLVDELWLTIEPKIFGNGATLIADGPYEVDLTLKEFEKVNDKGTLITKYSVTKNPDLT